MGQIKSAQADVAFTLKNPGRDSVRVLSFESGCRIVLFFTFIYIVTYRKPRYRLRVIKGDANTAANDEEVKLVSFYNNKAAVVDED